VVQCTCGIVYMLYKWCRVHVMFCTHYAGGVVYRWYCVHVVHAVLVHMWYYVHVVHVVVYMWYYISSWCSCGIMTCVFVVLYSVYVYVL